MTSKSENEKLIDEIWAKSGKDVEKFKTLLIAHMDDFDAITAHMLLTKDNIISRQINQISSLSSPYPWH